jgi:hypothetical protein
MDALLGRLAIKQRNSVRPIAKRRSIVMDIRNRRWLTIADVAALLSINPKTASAWCLTHRLPAARIGGRGRWFIDRLKLEESLESQIKDIHGRRGRVASRIPSCALAPLVHHRRGDPGEKKSTG